MSSAYDQKPRDALIASLNIDTSPTIEDSGKLCHVCNLAGVISVAVYRHPSGRVYIRALDLANPQVRTSINEPDDKNAEEPRKIITRWCARFIHREGTKRNPVPLMLQNKYRELHNDPEASIEHTYPIIPGQRGRTTGKFVAVELLPYLLWHMILYDNGPGPGYEKAWKLIKNLREFPGCPFSIMKEKTIQDPERRKKSEGISRTRPGPEHVNLAEELGKARGELNAIKDSRKREAQNAKEREKALEEEIKELKTENKKLQREVINLRSAPSSAPVRGTLAEEMLKPLFKKSAPSHCRVMYVGGETGHADIMITYRNKEGQLVGYALVDIKNYTNTVDGNQVDKLEEDIDSCTSRYGIPPTWAAIISLNTNIARASSGGLDYLYKTVLIRLISNFLFGSIEDDGSHAIKQLMAMGDIFLGMRSPTISAQSQELITATENKESCYIPLQQEYKKSYTKRTLQYKPRKVPVLLEETLSQTTEEEIEDDSTTQPSEETKESVEREEDSVDVTVRKALDPRIFKDVSNPKLTQGKYEQLVELDKLIKYQEGNNIPRKEVISRYAKLIKRSEDTVNRNIRDYCTIAANHLVFINIALR